MFLSTLKLAWRNLGRNRRRTAATGAALAIGICLCVASFGLVDGLSAQLLHSLTRLDIGHVQVHKPEFVERRSLQARIADPAAAVAAARNAGAKGVAARTYSFGLLSSKGKSAAVGLVGVDPVAETKVTELHLAMTEGRYLEPDKTPWPAGRALSADELAKDKQLTDHAESEALDEIDALESLDGAAATAPAPAAQDAQAKDRKSATRKLARALAPAPDRPPRVILGASLAKVLSVSVGDSLYVSTVTVDGGTEAAFLEVIGIYKTGTSVHDRGRIYLHIADARRLGHLGDAAHEIALSLSDAATAPAVAKTMSATLDSERFRVRAWSAVRPDILQMIKLNDVSTGMMVFIIFIVATLGVVNTMLMSVFERTRELGVLKAIGMSSRHIVGLIVGETLLLVLGASVVGTALGLGLDLYMVHYGVDLRSVTSGFSMGGIGINPVIYGVITPQGLIVPTVVLSSTCLLASLYPAIRAARMQPAVGMRET